MKTRNAQQTQEAQKPIHISFRGMDPSHVALIDVPKFSPKSMGIEDQIALLETISTLVEEATFRTGPHGGTGKLFAFKIEEAIKCLKAERARGATGMDWEVGKDKLALGRYKIRQIKSSENETPLPNISWDYTAHIEAGLLAAQMKGADVLADYVTFGAKPDAMTFFAKGEIGEYSDSIAMPSYRPAKKRGDPPELIATAELKGGKDQEATYSMEYITPFLKATQTYGKRELELRFSSARPMLMRIPKLGLDYYLAPRVDT